MAALVKRGVAASRLTAKGYGQSAPLPTTGVRTAGRKIAVSSW